MHISNTHTYAEPFDEDLHFNQKFINYYESKGYDTIILHIPHSGRQFIKDRAEHSEALEWNARDIIDWFTDELFIPSNEDNRIIPVVFPYCRTECDVERMIDDPLEEQNLGICYDSDILKPKHGFFKTPEKKLWHHDREDYEIYVSHHHKMESLILKHDNALIIDCHSFSSYPTVLQPDYNEEKQYDICIGYNEDKTKPDSMIIGTIRSHFEQKGYQVGINCPYSNSKTFNVPTSYKSIMIEVNKRCYMNEFSYCRGDNMKQMHECIEELYTKVLNENKKE